MLDSPEGPALALTVLVLSALVGAVTSALTVVMTALPEELLMAVRDEGGRDAVIASRVLVDRTVLRARLLVGRVLSVTALTLATAHLLRGMLTGALGVLVIAAVALLYALLAKVAQTVARSRARSYGLRFLRWARPIELLFAPFAWPLHVVAALVERLLPANDAEVEPEIAAREVEHIIERREEDGTLPEEHAQLLLRVLEFEDTVAREVMVPRTRMVAVDLAMPSDAIIARVVEEGHSRYPVYRGRVDHIEGILHAKDLFRAIRDAGTKPVDPAVLVRKPVLYVAESQRIGALLREMQSKRQHLAVVVDEFGGTAGVVTLEDILEEIVGEIQDEHDAEETLVTEIAPGVFLADARISVHDLAQILGTPLAGVAEDAEVDSLGGLVVDLAGKVPEPGARLSVAGLDFVVREADEKHVTRVEIRRRDEGAVTSPEGAA